MGITWVTPLQLQDLALPIVEFHEVPVSPFLQPVGVPLDGSTTLWHIRRSKQSFLSLTLLGPEDRHLQCAICNHSAIPAVVVYSLGDLRWVS